MYAFSGSVSLAAVKTIGRYSIYDPLAAGGMAVVHLGRLLGPVGFSRTVAIKRMRADYLADAQFVSMFIDEARVAGRIRHSNVVAVNDVVVVDDELLLVMEYVNGETLSRLMQLVEATGGVVPAPIAATIMRDALVGLHAAHETKDEQGKPLGIVHRDVSPQNVIVGTDGVSRVLDFGIAKAIGASHVTRDGEIKGKLSYMAPEQLNGHATPATDTFAAAVTLWELLTGERLFRGATDAETVGKLLGGHIRKPSEVRPALGTSYDDVVLRGLARDPSERFPTSREMALALAQSAELAEATAVGEWVSEIARERLVERERLVALVESGAAPPSEPRLSVPTAAAGANDIAIDTSFDATAQAFPPSRRSGGRSRLVGMVVGAAVLVAIVGFGSLRLLRDDATARAAVDPAPVAAPAAPPVSAAPSSSAAPSIAAPVMPALSASTAASSRPPPPVAKTVRSPSPQPSAPKAAHLPDHL